MAYDKPGLLYAVLTSLDVVLVGHIVTDYGQIRLENYRYALDA